MELEILNRPYLELSQVATAKTKVDLRLDCVQKANDRRGKLLTDIANCNEVERLPTDLKTRIIQEINSSMRVES